MIKKFCFSIIMGYFVLSIAHALPIPDQDPRVKKIYEQLQGQPFWIQNGALTACGTTLMEALSHADEEGLWATDYTPFIDAIKNADLTSIEEQKKADELLTLAALNYISDMKGERLKPRSADKTMDDNLFGVDEAELRKTSFSYSSQCDWIRELAPASSEYQFLKQQLSFYRQKEAQGGWPQLPKGTKLKKGDQGRLVETLRAQLIGQDALSGSQNSDLFDEKLVEAVKNYQTLHGLETDGRVGGATLTALNIPVEDRIRSIIIGLERHRWLPHFLPFRYIQVNIPGFYLKAVDMGSPVFYMPIITGKDYTRTPVFNAPMTEIIFNPSWHVPTSIVKELLPKIERNPEGYARRGYRLSYQDSRTRITQSPGNANALGKIRFTIQSPYAIYLHGTPQQKLFKKAKRALSHGCIRVENPHKLAEFVLNDPQKWPLSRIKQETLGTRTKHIKLQQPLPVMITYFTVFEGEDHKLHIVDDTYGQDKKVWQAMEKVKRDIKTD